MNVDNCCRDIDGSATNTEWFYPNASRVDRKGRGSFYRTRGPKLVILHHDGSLISSGIFRCQIQDNFNYFGIYPENEGNVLL